MCSDKNPFEGKIARNLGEMVRISEQAREWEKKTGQSLIWVDLETGNEVATNLL